MSKDHKNNIKECALASPADLKRSLPATETDQEFIHNARETVKNILRGDDKRILLIMGPCSIHDVDAAKEYASKLKVLANEVADTFFILMRTYFEKPRTTIGWKGILFDPHLDGSNDINTGLKITRELLLYLAEEEIPTATEFLDPSSAPYISDLITWGCIGSRTAESQTHRELASGLPMPVGFKNNTDGNTQIAVNGVLAASQPHSVISIDDHGQGIIIKTDGNSQCHIVLRGGDLHTNYDPQSISSSVNALKKAGLPESLIVDCSHGNSGREHEKQIAVFQSLIHQVVEGNSNIRGLILESNLFEGRQTPFSDKCTLKYGVSITDPCLSWDKSEQLIRWGSIKLQQYYEDQLTTRLHASPFNLE